nr:unnamed protein product [Digitaria exilis]
MMKQDCGFAVGTGRIDEIYCLCYADEEGEYRKPPNRIPRPLEISIRHVGSTRRRRWPVNPIQVRRVLLTPSEPPTFLNPPPVTYCNDCSCRQQNSRTAATFPFKSPHHGYLLGCSCYQLCRARPAYISSDRRSICTRPAGAPRFFVATAVAEVAQVGDEPQQVADGEHEERFADTDAHEHQSSPKSPAIPNPPSPPVGDGETDMRGGYSGFGGARHSSNSSDGRGYNGNPCLTMHQPWASLLVHGIKCVEGRSWPPPITGPSLPPPPSLDGTPCL